MDSWNENEVKAMRVGGNQALLDFFQRHNISRQAPISVKYKTETASLYREMYVFYSIFDDRIQAQVDGTAIPEDRALPEDETNANLVLQTYNISSNYSIAVNLLNLQLIRISVFVLKQKSV